DPRDRRVADVADVHELVVGGERARISADRDVVDERVLARVDHGDGVRPDDDTLCTSGRAERENRTERSARENGRPGEERPAAAPWRPSARSASIRSSSV